MEAVEQACYLAQICMLRCEEPKETVVFEEHLELGSDQVTLQHQKSVQPS